MKLSEILTAVGVPFYSEDVDVVNICDDSRCVTDGSLFVCIKGEKFDSSFSLILFSSS